MKFPWKDATGREWSAFVGIAIAETLKTQGVDLLEPKQLAELYKDPFGLVRVNAIVHQSQCEALGLSAGDFLELSTETEEVASASVAALEAALVDFFRRVKRGALATVVQKASESAAALDADQILTLNSERAAKAMRLERAAALGELDKAIDEVIERNAPGNASGSSPES
jgi:hypothetical protein